MPRINFRSLKPEPQKATVSGICPMCHVYIAKGRSRVVKLYRPLTPRYEVWKGYGEEVWQSRDTGEAYNHDGSPIRTHPRWYVHERCYPKAEKALDRGDD